MSTQSIKTLTISFNLSLHSRQIPQWRGAFIEMAGWEDELFHNHRNETTALSEEVHSQPSAYHHRYPLIQYRVRRGKATIYAINEGVEALQQILANSDWKLNWHGRTESLQVEDLEMKEHYFRMLPQPKEYRLTQWLALNQESYRQWQQCNGLLERAQLLQRKIENHLVGLFKGLQWDWPERFEVQLQNIDRSKVILYHEAQLMCFDVAFTANVLLPSDIGIGKGVSHGFGVVFPKRIAQNKKIQTTGSGSKLMR